MQKISHSKKVKEMQKLRNEGWLLTEIGKQFNISSERVRQILLYAKKKKLRCKQHNVFYYDDCEYCLITVSYKKFLELLSFHIEHRTPQFEFEVNRLSRDDRNKNMVIQRSLFITMLRDKYSMDINTIAKLLKKDRTSILNLYRKYE